MASSNKKRAVRAKLEAETAKVGPTKAVSRATITEFNPDYTYVKKDLTRIAILAGTFFVILVVLSFFLR
jgi:hypothetical protein